MTESTSSKPLGFAFKKKATAPTLSIANKRTHQEKQAQSISVFDADEEEDERSKAKKIDDDTVKLANLKAIPLISKNKWYGDAKKKDKDSPKLDSEQQELVNRILKRANGEMEEEEVKKEEDEDAYIPLLVKNAAPVDESLNDSEKFFADVEQRPDECDIEEYENMPIEHFGTLLLKGMGWKEGETLNPKRHSSLLEPVQVKKRYGRRGLGAAAQLDDQDVEDLLGKNKRFGKPKEEAKKEKAEKKSETVDPKDIQKGCNALVLTEPHRGLYANVLRFSSDPDYCYLKLAINKQEIKVKVDDIRRVTDKEFERGKRHLTAPLDVLKRLEDDKDKDSSRENNRNRESSSSSSSKSSNSRSTSSSSSSSRSASSSSSSSKSGSNSGSSSKKSSSSSSSSSRWLRQNLIVRLVSKKYGKGRYYNSKILIENVLTPSLCECRTLDTHTLLTDVTIDMLETVIPREPGSIVVIVQGKFKGYKAELLERNSKKCEAIVQLVEDKITKKFSFDDICQSQ